MSKLSNTTQHNLATFGQLGSTAATGAITPPSGKSIVAVTALANAGLTGSVSATGTDASFTGSATIPAGVTVYGKWASVTTSAAVIAYFG